MKRYLVVLLCLFTVIFVSDCFAAVSQQETPFCHRLTDPTDTADVVAGTNKGRIRFASAGSIASVYACVNTTGTTDVVTIDINKINTGTILSTKLTVDATEKCSFTALAAYVISDTAIAANDEFQFDVDDDDGGNTAAGLEVGICVY